MIDARKIQELRGMVVSSLTPSSKIKDESQKLLTETRESEDFDVDEFGMPIPKVSVVTDFSKDDDVQRDTDIFGMPLE